MARIIGKQSLLAKAYKEIAFAYSLAKDYSNAYHYHTQYASIHNQLLDEENNREIKKLQVEYETQKKELTIAQQQTDLASSQLSILEKQKALILSQAQTQQKEITLQRKQNQLIAEQLAKTKIEKQLILTDAARLQTLAKNKAQQKQIFYIIVAAILILSVATFIYYNIQKRHKIEYTLNTLKAQMVASKAQIETHFISNAFSALRTHLANKPHEAENYLIQLAIFMRDLLNQSTIVELSLSNELNTLSRYLQLEQIRLPHTFHYTIHVDENINPATLTVPALILQPIAENAILHGFSNIQYQGQLTIAITTQNHQIHYTITDNGIGRKQNTHNPTPRLTSGINITTQRLHHFAHLLKKNATIHITDPPQGLQVHITFPLATHKTTPYNS